MKKFTKAFHIIFCALFFHTIFHTVLVKADENTHALDRYLHELVMTGNIVGPSDLSELLFVLDHIDPHHVEEALIEIQPSWYATLDWSVENTMTNAGKILSDNILARVREYRYSSCLNSLCGVLHFKNLWIAGMGGHLQQDKIQRLPEFHANEWGILSGFDFVLIDWLTVGFSGGYTHTRLEWDKLKGDNSIQNFYLGPYAAWSCGPWILEASILKGFHRYRTERHLHFGFINHKTKSMHYGDSILGHMGLSWNRCWGYNYEFSPYVTADYIYIHQKSIKEKGAHHLDQVVNARNPAFFQGEAGIALSGTYKTERVVVAPTIKGGYQNITPTVSTRLRSHFAHTPGSYAVETTKDPIYQWVAGLFVNVYALDCADFSFSYNGAFGDKRTEYYYTGQVDWSF